MGLVRAETGTVRPWLGLGPQRARSDLCQDLNSSGVGQSPARACQISASPGSAVNRVIIARPWSCQTLVRAEPSAGPVRARPVIEHRSGQDLLRVPAPVRTWSVTVRPRPDQNPWRACQRSAREYQTSARPGLAAPGPVRPRVSQGATAGHVGARAGTSHRPELEEVPVRARTGSVGLRPGQNSQRARSELRQGP